MRAPRSKGLVGLVCIAAVILMSAPSPAHAATSSRTLTIVHYQQEKSNWCWATAAQVVVRYFTGTKFSQCKLVDSQVVAPGGCPNIGGFPYQVENIVDSKLGVGGSWYSGALSESRLKTEMVNDRPIISNVQWESSGGLHMFTIYGYYENSTGVYARSSNYNGKTGTGTAATKAVHAITTFGTNTKHTNLRNMYNIKD